MTEERPIQAKECFEHHMMLKGSLEKINHFLFGSPERGNEVSFVSKVNLMFDELKFIKQSLVASIFIILSACIFLGKQLYQLEINSRNLNAYMEKQQQIELRLAQLEIRKQDE